MTLHRHISASISRAVISALLAFAALSTSAQGLKPQTEHADTTRFFRGLQVMVDAVGPIQLAVSDYGQYEAALRINLKDKYFPIFELGYGKANHEDDPVTHVVYKTSAPYGKVGMDFNILKNKHDIYRVYVGARYAYTSFKYDAANPTLTDPVWQDPADIEINNASATCHWQNWCSPWTPRYGDQYIWDGRHATDDVLHTTMAKLETYGMCPVSVKQVTPDWVGRSTLSLTCRLISSLGNIKG